MELLKVLKLTKDFSVHRGLLGHGNTIRAVDNVSFSVGQGEILGLIGESGCGKTTTARLICRLLEATAGEILFRGKNIRELRGKELKEFRREIQVTFQHAAASLDPRLPVGRAVEEPLVIHKMGRAHERSKIVRHAMSSVALSHKHASRFPHELSGGELQRVCIARALTSQPKMLLLDEPFSALDVSIKGQLVNLLLDLKAGFGLTYMIIAHDLSLVRYLCDRVAVMYGGRIVEIGPVDNIFDKPCHPYTQALLSAAPVPDPKLERKRKRVILQGEPPGGSQVSSGCLFCSRCPGADDICGSRNPRLVSVSPNHSAACFSAAPWSLQIEEFTARSTSTDQA